MKADTHWSMGNLCFMSKASPRLDGLVVWFSFRVREAPGSNPGRAQNYFRVNSINILYASVINQMLN